MSPQYHLDIHQYPYNIPEYPYWEALQGALRYHSGPESIVAAFWSLSLISLGVPKGQHCRKGFLKRLVNISTVYMWPTLPPYRLDELLWGVSQGAL